ncbi:hypothetical protein Thiowin_02954 [Thiorhodovibrio winogradskyi]|uniref:Uncharacterized protein n=1 Tax=Thiorhodovibrio winogradskyi TaxID=77007 RepID=A0ABZ0SCS8_9GAMM|nr:hypothetical protein [Thiorhodovibrio winogradskyi]
MIRADPNKERLDHLITRWLKRHLQRLGSQINLEQVNSLTEDKAMLAENLENLVKRERKESREELARETACNLIKLGLLTDEQVAQATSLPLDQVRALSEGEHTAPRNLL